MDFSSLHLYLHFLLPIPVAYWFIKKTLNNTISRRKQLLKNYTLLTATMLVDLDHLLATPIYVADRCSIGFHPLHHEVAILCYAIMLLNHKLRLVAIGLLIHMSLDGLDCILV